MPPEGSSSLDRRSLLVGGLIVGTVAALPGTAFAAGPGPGRALRTDPFTLGVASGDPHHDGFVLWTRLAVEPLAGDGLGGMPDRPYPVRWEVATDPGFRTVVRRGTASARPAAAHSVHVELSGLKPGREYWYRFKVERYVSPVGRTRTAPDPATYGPALAMAFVSCSDYEHGYFTSYRRLAEERPDLILHLGDYQYEYRRNTYTIPGGNVRNHVGPETETLPEYRQRYAQYKTDPDLQAAHAAAPWLAVWDDHEVDNNWADGFYENPQIPQPHFRERLAAAFQAYYENMPLRRTAVPHGAEMRLYRRVRWGRMVDFHMLDTRQYRNVQACGDGYRDCPEATAPWRTITGDAQERWLLKGFRASRARWNVLGQQVFFAQRDRNAGPLKVTSMDAWDGYVASRDRITKGWVTAGVRNAVVLTGDVHAHWASDLKLNYDDPASATVGSELVATSITSGGNGYDSDPADNPFLAINPHLRFFNNQRGYVLTKIDKSEMKADFKVVPQVTVPGAAVHTKATFVIEDRVPGLNQTYLRPVGRSNARLRGDHEAGSTVRRECDRPDPASRHGAAGTFPRS
ncbi:alkaline phosphatase [Actinomadura craniellae]|uniref:Alkaline phosphatase n=1 Tax=Actinomadura craniellae TaxID=2231787 RepID=A0A365GY48_9ACTN|nr:alkaline phosphatase [Actinomadura craniellae]